MEKIRSAGCVVGEYIGNGQGEAENATEKASSSTDLDFGAVDTDWEADESIEDEMMKMNLF